MRILDKEGQEIINPDLSKGQLIEEKLFIKHHEAIEAVEEQWHYETEKVYPNGGKDLKRVIDVPAVEAQEAWDEYEDILRYTLYTPEELEELNKPSPDEDRDAMLVDMEMRLTLLELDVINNKL